MVAEMERLKHSRTYIIDLLSKEPDSKNGGMLTNIFLVVITTLPFLSWVAANNNFQSRALYKTLRQSVGRPVRPLLGDRPCSDKARFCIISLTVPILLRQRMPIQSSCDYESKG